MYGWAGPGVHITRKQDRIPAEQRWYALTGRVVEVRAEEDGDIHFVLADATGNQTGKVVVELPLESRWCSMRTTIFSWTDASFPFETRRGNNFSLIQPHVVTVVGKAFFDVDHAGKDTKDNRRNYDPTLAVWEIHPAMNLLVDHAPPAVAAPALASTPAPVAAAAPSVPKVVTILTPTRIAVPYGEITLTRGMRLEVVSRSGQSVVVRYMGESYRIPVSATDLR
ncbi:MAG: hypothetical protein QOH39_1135 [Verrucomicrobiota bacterium]|jgi:hypothetical protein